MLRFIYLDIVLLAQVSAYGYNFYYSVNEELQEGSIVGNLKKDFLKDHHRTDHSDDASLRFLFSPSSRNHNGFFHLDNSTGILSNKQILDREILCKPGGAVPSCRFTIDVKVTPKEYFAILKITVEIKDINDNSPRFNNSEYSFEISHQTKSGHTFQLPTAQDDDADEHGIENYILLEDESDPAFCDTFKLISRKMLDGSFDVRLEVKNKSRLNETDLKSMRGKIMVMDKGTPPQSDILTIVVNIIKISKKEPQFEALLYHFFVTENVENGTLVGQVKANANISETSLHYYIQDTRHRKLPFRINSKLGEIYVNGSIDYEIEKTFRFSVVAMPFSPHGSAIVTVEVTVIDTNDCPPEIVINTFTPNSRAQLKENSQEGTFIYNIRVVNKDGGLSGRSFCFAQSSYFALEEVNNSIDVQEYKLVSAAPFDREETSKHDIQIVCEQQGSPSLSSRMMTQIDILDENDNAPIFSQDNYVVDLYENTAPGSIPLVKLQATDIDEGQNAVLTYHLSPLNSNHSSFLFIDELDGGVYSQHTFDYESDPHSMFFLVRAVDSGETKMTGSTTLILNIVDINDNVPRFTQNFFEFHISKSELWEGINIGKVNSTDNDDSLENSRVTYAVDGSAQGSFFNIDPFSGELSLIKIPTDESVYNFNIVASNTFAKDVLNSSVAVSVHLDTVSKIFLDTTSAKTDIHVFTGSIQKGVPIYHIRVKNDHLMKLHFELLSEDTKDVFCIDPKSGVITAVKETERGLLFFNFTVLIMDENMNFEQTTLHLPVFVNNTDNHHNFLGLLARNPENIAILACVAVLLIAFILATIWMAVKCKCLKRTKISTHLLDKDTHRSSGIMPNVYESEPRIYIKDESSWRKEVKFSFVNLEEGKTEGILYNHVSHKSHPDIPYEPWISSSKKPSYPTHEEETSLTDSGKGTSDEGDTISSQMMKIKESKLADVIGFDGFSHSIKSRETRMPNQHTRFNSTCLKNDNLLPMVPLELSFHCGLPTFKNQTEDCELCLMDQKRNYKLESTASITTTV